MTGDRRFMAGHPVGRGYSGCEDRATAERYIEIYGGDRFLCEVWSAAHMDAVRALIAAYPNTPIEELDVLWRAIPSELRVPVPSPTKGSE
jgi:hypothetical protein